MATTDIMRLPSAGHGEHGDRFNYKGMHRYIITQPVHAGKKPFAGPEPVFTVLNALRESAAEHRFDVYAYCFLPDRLLLIIRGKDDGSDMKAFLSAFRTGSGAALEPSLGHSLWSRKYTERVLRKTEETRVVAREILLTPVKEGLAPSPAAYPFLGSFTVQVAAILSIPSWEKKDSRPFKGPGKPLPGAGKRPQRPGRPPFDRGKPGRGGPGRPDRGGPRRPDRGRPNRGKP